jgi:hypothetical protein
VRRISIILASGFIVNQTRVSGNENLLGNFKLDFQLTARHDRQKMAGGCPSTLANSNGSYVFYSPIKFLLSLSATGNPKQQ